MFIGEFIFPLPRVVVNIFDLINEKSYKGYKKQLNFTLKFTKNTLKQGRSGQGHRFNLSIPLHVQRTQPQSK